MIPQASKELLARIRFPWQVLFQGRYLVITNTIGGGCLMALGDSLEQTREIHLAPGRVRDWNRTGEEEKLDVWISGCHAMWK